MNLRRLFLAVSILMMAVILPGCNGGISATVPPTLTPQATKGGVVETRIPVTPLPAATATLVAANTSTPISTFTPAATLVLCKSNNADFVADVTIPDGTSIKPGEQFTKTWRLRNTGKCTWGTGYRLAYVDGPTMAAQAFAELTQEIQPNQTSDISVVFTAPREAGAVKSRWQMQDSGGAWFGKKVYVQIYAGTSPVDPIVGVWRGTYAGGADAGDHADQVSGEQEIEIRAVCHNGQPCVQIREAGSTIEYPFDPKGSAKDNLCFSDGFQGYCFSLQKDGTLKFEAGGPGYGVSGIMHKVSE